MSCSKLRLYGIGIALFRTLPTRRILSPFFLFSHHRRRRSFSSPATTAAATETLSSVDQHHPWPEWVSFVDTLNTKGYLTITKPSSSSPSPDSVYVNINLLMDACLSFARHRSDLFKSLPLKDIQGVVEGGCPNILRKAVNSAKRLRVHVRLDEGDVCSACNLRHSCDKAYVILKEFEADAQTVDMVRILMFYALDPLVLSGGEKPPGRQLIESSARKLLSQLIELSESSRAHASAFTRVRPKPTAQDAEAKGQPLNFFTNKWCKDVEMKKGDWMCPKCNFMNFSRNMHSPSCNEDKPKDINQHTVEMKKGDWICPKCSFLNFFRNTHCLMCGTDEDDYNCPEYGFLNFARNVRCLRCEEPRPKKHWSCPKCEFMNFVHIRKCVRCLEPNPNPYRHLKISTIVQEVWL